MVVAVVLGGGARNSPAFQRDMTARCWSHLVKMSLEHLVVTERVKGSVSQIVPGRFQRSPAPLSRGASSADSACCGPLFPGVVMLFQQGAMADAA